MSGTDEDEFERDAALDDGEEEEEEENSNTDHDHDDEEDNDDDATKRKGAARIDERFVERIPVKKPVVSTLALRLPNDLLSLVRDEDGDNDEDNTDKAPIVDVEPHLTRQAYSFQKVCRKALNEMRRTNVMRQLAQDVDGLRAFVEFEQARRRQREENGLTEDDVLAEGIDPAALEEMEEILEKLHRVGAGLAMQPPAVNGEESGTGNAGAAGAADDLDAADADVLVSLGLDPVEDGEEKAPLYWLEPLLANDVPTLERTLAAMYGWAVPPPPPPRPPRTVSFAAGKRSTDGNVSHPFGGDEEGDEEEEEVVVPDPARARPSWFKSSGAFGGEDHGTDSGDDKDRDDEANQDEEGAEVGQNGTDAEAGAARPSIVDGGARASGMGGAGSNRASSVHAAPLTSLPAFGDVNRRLWIVFDQQSEAWHLLDEHPLLRTLRCRMEKLAGPRQGDTETRDGDGDAAEDEEEEPQEAASDDQDDDDDDDDEDEEENENGGRRRQTPGVPDYKLETMLPVDAVVLSALCCPAALRLCVLQRRAPSLACVEHWVRHDLAAGFPVLSTVHAAIVASRAADGPRLPYPLTNMTLDFNLFLQEPFLTGEVGHSDPTTTTTTSTTAPGSPQTPGPSRPSVEVGASALALSARGGSRPHSGKPRPYLLSLVSLSTSPYAKHLLCRERQVSLMSSSLSHAGRFNMEMLLAAGVFPSRPVRLAAFGTTEGVRLALWLLMSVPRTVLVRWGFKSDKGDEDRDERAARRAAAEEADWYGSGTSQTPNGAGEDDQDEDEEEEEEVPPEEETIDIVCDRIARMRRRQVRERQTRQGPLLRLAPFVMELILEVRRRIAREMKTKPPSKLTLVATLERLYKSQHVEDGKPRGDPLLTADFCLALATPVEPQNKDTESAPVTQGPSRNTPASEASGNVADNAAPPRLRHQRLYQSDLILLLLALTSTPQPRGVVTARVDSSHGGRPDATTGRLKKPSPPLPPAKTTTTHTSERAQYWSDAPAPGHGGDRGGSLVSQRGLGLSFEELAASGHIAVFNPAPDIHERGGSLPPGSDTAVAPAVLLRRRSRLLLEGRPSDAHEALFTELLTVKLAKSTATPLTLLRSGTLRLLLRALPRFRQERLMQAFCEAIPLNQVLGQSETCPLPELVHGWSAELAKALKLELVTGMVQHRYLDVFANRFWYELHCRHVGGLYGEAVVAVMQRELMVLFEKVDERLRQYQDAIATLGGVVSVGVSGGRRGAGGAAGVGAAGASGVLGNSMRLGGGGGGGGAAYEGRRMGAGMGSCRLTGRSTSIMGSSRSAVSLSPQTDAAGQLNSSHRSFAAGARKSITPASVRAAAASGPRHSFLSIASTDAVSLHAPETLPTAGTSARSVGATAVAAAAPTAVFSGRQLSLYDAEFKRELTRVKAIFDSLPMSPGTYLTPYTLFALIFGDTADMPGGGVGGGVASSGPRSIDIVAVYYIMVVQGITTVRADPFFGAEMPALEYAVRELNVPAALTLVQLGASLEELIEGGTMTVEQYCEVMLAPEEVEELRIAADVYTQYIATNPDANYGILRNVRSAVVGVT